MHAVNICNSGYQNNTDLNYLMYIHKKHLFTSLHDILSIFI